MLSFRSAATVLSSLVAATGLAAAVAPAASAAPICREVDVQGFDYAIACVLVDPHQNGLTVAPEVRIGCSFLNGSAVCRIQPVIVGTTGYDPAAVMPTVGIDLPTLSVYSTGGSLGTVWVDGTPVGLTLPPFCVGDPAFC